MKLIDLIPVTSEQTKIKLIIGEKTFTIQKNTDISFCEKFNGDIIKITVPTYGKEIWVEIKEE
jgi:hypothetical protein